MDINVYTEQTSDTFQYWRLIISDNIWMLNTKKQLKFCDILEIICTDIVRNEGLKSTM